MQAHTQENKLHEKFIFVKLKESSPYIATLKTQMAFDGPVIFHSIWFIQLYFYRLIWLIYGDK